MDARGGGGVVLCSAKSCLRICKVLRRRVDGYLGVAECEEVQESENVNGLREGHDGPGGGRC